MYWLSSSEPNRLCFFASSSESAVKPLTSMKPMAAGNDSQLGSLGRCGISCDAYRSARFAGM